MGRVTPTLYRQIAMWFCLMVCTPCDLFQGSESPGVADVVSALNARFRAGTPSDDWGWVRMAPPTPRGQSGQAMAESRAGSEVPNQPRCGSRDTRAASWESLGRSEVRAEGSGVMPQDCSNVSGNRGSRKGAALAS